MVVQKWTLLDSDRTELIWDNPQTKLSVKIQEPNVLPDWFQPICLSRRFEKTDTSQDNFECGVCYFELWRSKVCQLRRYTRRVCEHYIHCECQNHLLDMQKKTLGKREQECPICGARYTEVKEVPDLMKDPRGWFQVVDADFEGSLSKSEVLNALGSVLPVEREKLTLTMDTHWGDWDPDRSGTITIKEFLVKGVGLRDYIVKHLSEVKKTKDTQFENIPDLDTHPHEWFEYWDIDQSGTLELHELIRAFIRTFCLTNWGEPIFPRQFDMRNLQGIVWNDLGFHPMDSIDFPTFIEPNGLADTFLHNQIHSEYFGDAGGGF